MKRYHNKQPHPTAQPQPCHWTRKPASRSWKPKVKYESEDAAAEWLALHPRLVIQGYTAYQCPLCCKWHVGKLKSEK